MLESLHPQIIRIRTGYVNAYLFKNGNRSLLVDTGAEKSGKQILRAIEREGLQPSDIRLILLTHPHYDHCRGARKLQRITGAKVVVQKEDETRFRKGHCRFPRGATFLLEAWVSMGRLFLPWLAYFPAIQPDITFQDEWNLKESGIDGIVVHTPGHTRGSLTVIIEGKHAIAGDTVFGVGNRSPFPPFVDDPSGLVCSWKKLIDAGVEYLYPGHGHSYGIDRLSGDFRERRKKYGV